MAGKPTTQNIIRVTVARAGKVISGPNADGTKTIAVKSIVSAFGPKNLGNVYCVKVAADYEFPETFDLRNAESSQWLGTWIVLPGNGINATFWDMTTAQQTSDGSKPKTGAASAPTAVPAPYVSRLIVPTSSDLRAAMRA